MRYFALLAILALVYVFVSIRPSASPDNLPGLRSASLSCFDNPIRGCLHRTPCSPLPGLCSPGTQMAECLHVFFNKSEYKNEFMISRFILSSDKSSANIADIDLRDTWWSRPYEYDWAAQFAGSRYVVLDAACGISHPFKWHLGNTCKSVWACDTDPRIQSYEQILEETRLDLGDKAYRIMTRDPPPWKGVQLACASIYQLPSYMPQFDRIFCISTLEHMIPDDRKKALHEFARQLKPGGLVVLTVDYPEIKPDDLLNSAAEAGLIPAGPVELGDPPKEALTSSGLCVYRCILKHKL